MDYKINKSKAISKNNMESHEEDLVIKSIIDDPIPKVIYFL